MRDWRQAGFDVVSAWPWSVRRGDKTDFNDLIKVAGPQEVRERISLTADPQPVIAQDLVSLADARLTLDRRTAEFFSVAKNWEEGAEPAVHALSVSLGTGKTETAITHVIRMIHELRAKGDRRVAVFASPEHGLNAEVANRIRSHREAGEIRVEIWRGRESRLPGSLSSEKMCGDVESIREAATMKVEADEVCEECPLAPSCHYLAQHKRDADIWLVAHPMLFQEAPKPIKKRGVAAVVVDESPWVPGLIDAPLVPLDALDRGVLPKPLGIEGERLEDIRQRLKRALVGQPLGPVTQSALKAVGFDSETGRAAGKAEWRRKAAGGHWRERRDNKTLGAMSMLWDGVADLLSRKDDEASGWVSLTRTEEGALALLLAGRKCIGGAWRVPTLLIDANLDEDLLRPFWPTVEVTGRIEVETPHQRITQIVHPFSKNMLAPREQSDPAKEARRAKSRLKVSTFIQKLDRQGCKTLVVSNKATIEALKLPSFIEKAHFNAVAGKDVWSDVDLLIVVGRTQPSPATVERMAETLTGRPCKPVAGWFPQQDVWRLQSVPGGVQRVLSEGVLHSDPIAEGIRNRICEAEVMQAIGRGRGVNRTADRPLEVVVLSDAVLPVPVDRFASPDEALRTTAKDEMLALGGVAFEDATAAHKAYPDLWPTIEAAKKALQRRNTGTFWYNDISIPKCPRDRVAEVVYQRAGAKQRKGRAVVDLLIAPDPRAAIEAALGELVFFEKLDL